MYSCGSLCPRRWVAVVVPGAVTRGACLPVRRSLFPLDRLRRDGQPRSRARWRSTRLVDIYTAPVSSVRRPPPELFIGTRGRSGVVRGQGLTTVTKWLRSRQRGQFSSNVRRRRSGRPEIAAGQSGAAGHWLWTVSILFSPPAACMASFCGENCYFSWFHWISIWICVSQCAPLDCSNRSFDVAGPRVWTTRLTEDFRHFERYYAPPR